MNDSWSWNAEARMYDFQCRFGTSCRHEARENQSHSHAFTERYATCWSQLARYRSFWISQLYHYPNTNWSNSGINLNLLVVWSLKPISCKQSVFPLGKRMGSPAHPLPQGEQALLAGYEDDEFSVELATLRSHGKLSKPESRTPESRTPQWRQWWSPAPASGRWSSAHALSWASQLLIQMHKLSCSQGHPCARGWTWEPG